MCPRLTPAAFGAVSCPVAGGAKAAARRNTDAIVVFTRTLYSESTTPGRSTRASNRSSASSSRRPRNRTIRMRLRLMGLLAAVAAGGAISEELEGDQLIATFRGQPPEPARRPTGLTSGQCGAPRRACAERLVEAVGEAARRGAGCVQGH